MNKRREAMSDLSESEFREKIGGVLLGTALGDALGFIAEGMARDAIARRFGKVKRFYVLADRGFVTDDTEHTALVAQCLARHPSDLTACAGAFRRAIALWFFCMPFGIGRATARACIRVAFGIKKSGVESAGNGAAMRSAIVGVFFYDRAESRERFAEELAAVTHSDARAVEGALFVAELARACVARASEEPLSSCFSEAIEAVNEPQLRTALETAAAMAANGETLERAAELLNRPPAAYIVNSLAFSTYAFMRFGDGDILECLAQTIAGGGDTDTNAAIVGAWLGALHGDSALPEDLIAKIDDGPFGPAHLRRLADALTDARFGRDLRTEAYSLVHSAARNICLIPVILVHAVYRRLRS